MKEKEDCKYHLLLLVLLLDMIIIPHPVDMSSFTGTQPETSFAWNRGCACSASRSPRRLTCITSVGRVRVGLWTRTPILELSSDLGSGLEYGVILESRLEAHHTSPRAGPMRSTLIT